MNKLLLTISISLFTLCGFSQVNQITVGKTNINTTFNAVKFDASDGGSINAGFMNDMNGTNGNDLYLVKLDGNQHIVWQKSISNPGDDYFNQVIICTNGDYLAIGKITQGGVPRGVACRINKLTGNIIWTATSLNSSLGEIFFDVVETALGNIAITGGDSYVPGSANTFNILLNASGATIWSKVSTYGTSDFGYSINQLPNGNLIVGTAAFNGSSYNAIITEVNELTAATISQSAYSINITAPNQVLTLNSMWPLAIRIRNGVVYYSLSAFQGSNSSSYLGIYTYDQTSKILNGNIYYHTGDINSVAYNYIPIGTNDFLISHSYGSATKVYVSRVTNGSVVYDQLINSSVTSIQGLDTTSANAIYTGSATYTANNTGTYLNTISSTYNLIAPRTTPTSTSPCNISNSSTLSLLPQTLNPVASNISFVNSNPLGLIVPTLNTPTNLVFSLCGTALPVSLLNFQGRYNAAKNMNELKWSNASEINSKNFIVKKSNDDGNTYSTIGVVNAKGVSNVVANYTFNDTKPTIGNNLYFLQEVDKNGRSENSDVISISKNQKKNSFFLTPNPAHEFTMVNSSNLSGELIQIEVYDASGRLIKKQSSVINSSLPVKVILDSGAGSYYLKVVSSDSIETLKLLLH